jgi:hypothetical protein
MFQTHCYDSWLSPEAKRSPLSAWSQLGGTLPAPLFIFLAGVSVALVTERLREMNVASGEIVKQLMLRGGEVFALAILFRLQEYLLGIGWVPWTDLLRVDVLNVLGLSMILLGAVCWLAIGDNISRARVRGIGAALLTAGGIALLTPPLWTTARPRFLPWPIESYVNGVHVFDQPQPWLFPIFPWVAFAFAGLAVGFWLHTDFAKGREARAFALLGVAGVLAIGSSLLFDASEIRWYAVYDYWHTSPNFLLLRCGVLLGLVFVAYAWCRWGFGLIGFSPLAQLGRTSLLVYWVHIEFVYGRFSILPKRRCAIGLATIGLVAIFLSMLALSRAKTAWEARRAKPA